MPITLSALIGLGAGSGEKEARAAVPGKFCDSPFSRDQRGELESLAAAGNDVLTAIDSDLTAKCGKPARLRMEDAEREA